MSKKNTATMVHHYNQFLANLDKKCKEEKIREKGEEKGEEKSVKDSLQEIINNLCKIFDENHLDSPFFHGSNSHILEEKENDKKKSKRKNKRDLLSIKEKKHLDIDAEIHSLDDLLKLIDDYPIDNDIQYNINMKSLHNIKDLLKELNNMIGLHSLKNSIVEQILYFIQGLQLFMVHLELVKQKLRK